MRDFCFSFGIILRSLSKSSRDNDSDDNFRRIQKYKINAQITSTVAHTRYVSLKIVKYTSSKSAITLDT